MTFSANQRYIKLIIDKFAITKGIITRQTANVSAAVNINVRDGSVKPSTSKMKLLATLVNGF